MYGRLGTTPSFTAPTVPSGAGGAGVSDPAGGTWSSDQGSLAWGEQVERPCKSTDTGPAIIATGAGEGGQTVHQIGALPDGEPVYCYILGTRYETDPILAAEVAALYAAHNAPYVAAAAELAAQAAGGGASPMLSPSAAAQIVGPNAPSFVPLPQPTTITDTGGGFLPPNVPASTPPIYAGTPVEAAPSSGLNIPVVLGVGAVGLFAFFLPEKVT